MNAILPELEKLGASLVGISPQTVHQSYLMADQHKLQFPLLSDAGNQVARQFGLVYRVPEYQQEIYRRVFVNLPFVNGNASWELPIPATFVLGRSRSHADRRRTARERITTSSPKNPAHAVLYASINPDYTDRPEPADILGRISQLLS